MPPSATKEFVYLIRPHSLFALLLVVTGLISVSSAPAKAAICSVSATNVAFGSVDVLPGAAVDVTSEITISCGFSLVLATVKTCTTIGPGSSSDSTSRKLLGPSSATLRYELYANSSRTVVWPTSGGIYASGVADLFGNTTIRLTVYARLFGGQQTATVGAYLSNFVNSLAVVHDDGIFSGPSCPLSGFTSTSTTNFTATATVASACNVSATNLNFGSANTLSSALDSTSTVSVQCTNGAPYRIALGYGTGAGAGIGGRRYMQNGGTQIEYNIFRDSPRTLIWGDSLGVNTSDGAGNGNVQNLTAYGRVFPQTTPAPRIYTDTITATVNY